MPASQKRQARDSSDDEDDDIPLTSVGNAAASNGGGVPLDREPILVPLKKIKYKRGSKACLACRKIKSKCRGSEHPPCERCTMAGLDCIFEVSRRTGRAKSTAPKKQPEKTGPKTSHPPLTEAEQSPRTSHSQDVEIAHFMETMASPYYQIPLDDMSSLTPRFSEMVQNGNVNYGTLAGNSTATTATRNLPPLFSPSVNTNTSFTMPPSFPGSMDVLGAATSMSASNTSRQTAREEPSQTDAGDPSAAWYPSTMDKAADELAPISIFEKESRRTQHIDAQSVAGSSPTSTLASNAGVSFFPRKARYSLVLPKFRVAEVTSFLTSAQIDALFKFYFHHLHPSFSLLDPELHTPQHLAKASPFMLTVICALASHFAPEYQDIAPKIGTLAHQLCYELTSYGYKTLMIAQSLMLMTVWTIRTTLEEAEDDCWNKWALCKSTIQSVGLDRLGRTELPPPAELSINQINEIRTWIYAWIRDQRLSQQLGKQATLKADRIIYSSQLYLPLGKVPEDRPPSYICDMELIVARTVALLKREQEDAELTGRSLDFMFQTHQFEEQLTAWKSKCNQLNTEKAKEGMTPAARRLLEMQKASLVFKYNYSILIVCSFGLQASLRGDSLDTGYYFHRCYTAAASCIRIAKQDYAHHGYLRYAADATYVCISYAAVSLLRLCQPKLAKYHDHHSTILDLIQSIADTLEKESHSTTSMAYKYAYFLRALCKAQQDGIGSRVQSPVRGRTPTAEAVAPDDGLFFPPASAFSDILPSFDESSAALPAQWFGLEQNLNTINDLGNPSFWNSFLLPGMGNASTDFFTL